MRIGVFDSGLGGLIITRAFIQAMPEYDYLYLGDTARVPYGNRSQETIYQFSRQAMEYLFAQDCGLVIIACNTASAEALSRLQQEDLPRHPGRKVLGVVVPTVEEVAASGYQRIGVLATASTVASGAYVVEMRKKVPGIEVFQQASPLLVPLIENNGIEWVDPIVTHYLEPLLQRNIQGLLLGCTHYPYLKEKIRSIVGPKITVISQDEFMPAKLRNYLDRHPEIDVKLSKNSSRQFCLTDKGESNEMLAKTLFGSPISLENIGYLN